MSKVQRTAPLAPASLSSRAPQRRGLAQALPRPRGDTASERARAAKSAPRRGEVSARAETVLALTPMAIKLPAPPAARAQRRRASEESRATQLELVRRAEQIERDLEAAHGRWLAEEAHRRAAALSRHRDHAAQSAGAIEQARRTLHNLQDLHPRQHAQVVQHLLPPQVIAAYLPAATPRDLFFLANYMSNEQLRACVTAESAERLGPHLQNPSALYTCLQAGMGAFLIPWCSLKLLERFLVACNGGASMVAPYLSDTQVLQLLPSRAQLLVPCLAPHHIELCLDRGWAPQLVRYLQPESCAGIPGFKLRPLGRLLRQNPWLFCWLTIEQLAMLELSDVIGELAELSFLTPLEQMPEPSFAIIEHLLRDEQLRQLRRPRPRTTTPLTMRALIAVDGQGA